MLNRSDRLELSAYRAVGFALGVLLVVGLVMNAPDVGRYIKLKLM